MGHVKWSTIRRAKGIADDGRSALERTEVRLAELRTEVPGTCPRCHANPTRWVGLGWVIEVRPRATTFASDAGLDPVTETEWTCATCREPVLRPSVICELLDTTAAILQVRLDA